MNRLRLNKISPVITTVIIILASAFLPAAAGAQNGSASTDAESKPAEPKTYEAYNVDVLPASLVKMSDTGSPYVVVVDKSEQHLYIYKYDGNYHLVKSLQCSTGENKGIKQHNGDKKTPEGVYFFTRVLEKSDLVRMYGGYTAAQYGLRAFDMDYPNPVDRLMDRRGNGIWLHGTNEPERAHLPYSTRGCVVMRNGDVGLISPMIKLNDTPIIIVDNISYNPVAEIDSENSRSNTFLNNWKLSWEKRDFDDYIECYHPDFRSKNGNRNAWIAFKKQVLSNYNWIVVDMTDMRIFRAEHYYCVEFTQKFQTDIYMDYGLKRLYIVESDGRLSIIDEQWSELPGGEE